MKALNAPNVMFYLGISLIALAAYLWKGWPLTAFVIGLWLILDAAAAASEKISKRDKP